MKTTIFSLAIAMFLAATSFAEDTTANKVKTKSVERISSNTLIGTMLHGPNNKEVADIDDLVLDKEGRAQYAIVGWNSLSELKLEDSKVAIPCSSIEMKFTNQDGNKVAKASIPWSLEDLKKAPKVTLEGYQDLTVATFQDRNAKYFKAADPYRPENLEGLLLVSKLTDQHVMGSENEAIGHIDALIFNTENKTAEFAILGDGGTLGVNEKYTPVPVSDLEIVVKGNRCKVTLDASKVDIGAAPKATATNYEELDDEEFRNNVKTAFDTADSNDK